MILSQVYHTNRKFMSDGNLNKWKAYESLENVPKPTIRYYMSGDWLTAKEVKDRLAHL